MVHHRASHCTGIFGLLLPGHCRLSTRTGRSRAYTAVKRGRTRPRHYTSMGRPAPAKAQVEFKLPMPFLKLPMVDSDRAEQLVTLLSDLVDAPLYDESPRLRLSATLAATSLELARSVRVLCGADQLLGATVCLRTQFESLVRSVWVLHCATGHQVERLWTDELTAETTQGAKNIPLAKEMLEDMEQRPNLSNLLIALNDFKASAWQPLNSFVHAGLHAVIHTKFGWPDVLVDQTFRISNGLCVLAFTHLGLLTGKRGIQAEVQASTATFQSVLPGHR